METTVWPCVRVRWRIFALLFGFGSMVYVPQQTITVAAVQMMPQLGLAQLQVGWLEPALILGYAFSQMPGGIRGQCPGARCHPGRSVVADPSVE